MKVAGSRAEGLGMKVHALVVALAVTAFAAPALGAQAPAVDTLEIAPGAYFEETIFPPSDGSAWTLNAASLNGTGAFDAYIILSTDLIDAYPSSTFNPLIFRENQSNLSIEFFAPSRIQGYTLVIDNLDNARDSDAVPQGNLTVQITRTPPLRSNPEAQALLGVGAAVCAVVLGVAAVAVAIYLKRRPRADYAGELDYDPTRVEIDIDVPPPPRGAWARQAPDDALPGEPK